MSCGGCPPPPANSSNQNGGSNCNQSCCTSDVSGEVCICDQDNLDDCCGPSNNTCGGNNTCGNTRGNSQASYQTRGGSQQYNSQAQQRRVSGQNRVSGQGYAGASSRLNSLGTNGNGAAGPKKSNCACGPPQSANGSSLRQTSTDSKQRGYNGSNQYQTPNQNRVSAQQAWNQNQRVSMNQKAQEVGMRGSQQNQYRQDDQPKALSSVVTSQPKQIIAPCCFPNKSAMSLTDKTSQRTVSPTTSKTSGCPCNPDYPKPTEEPGDFVCPSCYEFEFPPEPPAPPPACTPAPPCPAPTPRSPPPCATSTPRSSQPPPPRKAEPYEVEPEPTAYEAADYDDMPKSKISGGHGFWQQLQFQVCQQQDNDDEEGDQCVCEGSQAPMDKSKKSGKVWQQLTLDIFQSKDDDGSDMEGDSKQGWQQQLKLQITQEKIGGDEHPPDNEPTEEEQCEDNL